MLINITQHCTLKCKHCMQCAGPERKEFMSQETFNQSLDFAKKIGANVIIISGGEPTSHPMFLNFIEQTIGQGFTSVCVCSNGTFLRDHELSEKFANLIRGKLGCYVQISSFKRLYDNYDEVHKPNLKALRLFGKQAVICDNDNDIKMKPLGRAASGEYYEEAKRVNGFPSCINPCLAFAQMPTELEKFGVAGLMERIGRFCRPIVSWDGSIRLGEAEQCKVIANISEPIEEVNKKLTTFRPCGGCDSFKWHFQNPSTEQERNVCKVLWPEN